MAEFQGSCHCGALRVSYTGGREPGLRRCGCGFCRRHGAIYAADPEASLDIEAEEGALRRYRFGHRTADFLICAHCGVLVAVVAEIDGALRGVANLAVMEPEPDLPSQIPLMDFDGEGKGDRIARRRRNWIGTVRLSQ